MSKIKVDQIESSSSKVELAPKGSGLVKVKGAGGADGTLQMTSSGGNNAVKIKSPNHAAGRSDTLILPDNNVGTDGFLRVKSVTGSGATAVGQLEFKVFPTIDSSNLDGSTFTTGLVPTANMPAATAAQGAGLQFVSKTTVASNSTIQNIEIDLDNNTDYLIFGKKVSLDSNSNNYPCSWGFIKQDGTVMRHDMYTHYDYTQNNYHQHSTDVQSTIFYINSAYNEKFTFMMALYNQRTFNHFYLEYGNPNASQPSMRFQRGSLSNNYNSGDYMERFRLFVNSSYSHYFTTDTEIILYKYRQ